MIKSENKNELTQTLLLRLLVLFSIIFPLIIYKQNIKLSISESSVWTTNLYADYFVKAKSYFLYLSSFVLLSVFLIGKKKLTLYKPYKWLCIFIGFIIISTLTSTYKHTAVWGFAERFEGFITWMCYFILFFISSQTLNNENAIYYFLKKWQLIIIPLFVLGLFQFFGFDFFNFQWFRKIIGENNDIKFLYPEGTVYLSFLNSNYAGLFFSMLTPLFYNLSLYNNKHRGRWIASAIGCFLLLFFSRSLSSIVASGLVCLVSTLLFLKSIKTKPLYYVIIFAGISITSAIGFSLIKIKSDKQLNNFYCEKVRVQNQSVNIVMSDLSLNFKLINGNIEFRDRNNKLLNIVPDVPNRRFICNETSYKVFDITIKAYEGTPVIEIFRDKFQLDIALKDNKFYFLDFKGNLKESLNTDTIPKIGFYKNEHFASGRGFIWARTIPMITDNLIIGKGADTFPYYFPKDDIAGNFNAFGVNNVYTDKPHNMYLQIILSFGLFALMSFIVLIIVVLGNAYKVFLLDTNSNKQIVVVLSSAILCFLITTMFNDSVIFVSPFFWILLGSLVGFSNNLKKT